MQQMSGQRGEGPVRPGADFAQKVAAFPGPVVIASAVPEGTRVQWGGEDADGHPWSLHVAYVAGSRKLLKVRTVRGTLDWTPVIETIEDFGTMMMDLGHDGEPEMPVTVTVDGLPVTGIRVDLPDISGVHLNWQGQLVFCFGDRSVIDTMELRTGTPADFAEFQAAFAAYLAEYRAAQS